MTFDRCPKKWLIEQQETMTILADIRRFKASGALPFGPSQADQDALFWEALDVVDSERRDVKEALASMVAENGDD